MLSAGFETTGCRRQFLRGYFGEQLEEPCDNCDNCDKAAARDIPDPAESPAAQEPEPMPFAVTVLCETEVYKTLSVELVLDKDLLHLPAAATNRRP